MKHVRILLVEDDVDWLEIYMQELQGLNYELVSARTVDQAVDLLSRESFAVIVADLRLFGFQDEFSGFEVLRRAREVAPDTLVITITAYGNREIARQAMNKGAYDYIDKPIDQRFKECVSRAVQVYLQKAQWRQQRHRTLPGEREASQVDEEKRQLSANTKDRERPQVEAMEYLNFDIHVTDRETRVVKSPAGEANAPPGIPWRKLQEQILAETSEEKRCRLPSVREFGMRLFDAVMNHDVKRVYTQSKQHAMQLSKGLRIRIRADSDLLGIPWEFLYDSMEGDFLALSRYTPVVRYIEMPHSTVETLRVKPPLRLLVVSASPADCPPLDIKREKRLIGDALVREQRRGGIEVDFVDNAKLRDLAHHLRRDYHVLHFVGHGSQNPQDNGGTLILEDEKGNSYPVDSQRLGRLVRDARSLHLVVLNVCQGATIVKGQLLPSLAGAMVRAGGVPAVVAMQFPISDEAAMVTSCEFYTALSEGYPVDAALAEARKQVDIEMPNGIEWATAVLFMRSHDGHLFSIGS